ncbi:lactoylglutathione lyase isoform X2 [Tanacetum coccineum]
MFRIKDPKASLHFYSNVLGMSLLKKLDFPDMKFSLYFMGYEDTSTAPVDSTDRTVWTFGKKATIELTQTLVGLVAAIIPGHIGISVFDDTVKAHIGITVDDTDKACKRFESKGVPFVKKPEDGKMKGIAFIKDPDGYWIEIFDTKSITNVATYSAPKPE